MSGTSTSARRPPARPLRLAESIASTLRLQILSGELDGDELPPAEVLLERVDASMPTLREAFRILETEGLMTVRRGRRGGTVVNRPSADAVARHVGLLLQSDRTPISDLADARAILEPLCASMAARRRQHASIGRELLALTDDASTNIDDGLSFTDHAGDFHTALVAGSGNHTMSVVLGVLESVWRMQERGWAQMSVERDNYPSLQGRRAVIRAHERIAHAIREGDADAAAHATLAHLKSAQSYVTAGSGTVNALDSSGAPLV